MKKNKNSVFPEQKNLNHLYNFFEQLVFNLEKFKRFRKFKKSKIHLTGVIFFVISERILLRNRLRSENATMAMAPWRAIRDVPETSLDSQGWPLPMYPQVVGFHHRQTPCLTILQARKLRWQWESNNNNESWDVSPIKHGECPACHVSFQGCTNYKIGLKQGMLWGSHQLGEAADFRHFFCT